MLEKITIKYYRGISNFEMNFSEFCIIYGENSIGKTRIITFIRDLLNFKNNISGSILLNHKGIRLEFTLDITDGEVKEFKIRYKYNSSRFKTILDITTRKNSETENKFIYNPSVKNFLGYFVSLNIIEEVNKNILSTLTGFKYYLEDDENIENFLDKYRYLSATDPLESKDEEEFSFITFRNKEKESYEMIETKINDILPQIDINFKQFKINIEELKENELYKIKSFEYIINNGKIFNLDNEEENNKISRGIRKFVRIYIKILEFINSNNNVFILDEIDPYMHDTLYRQIILQLIIFIKKNTNKQIILISHNMEILNHVDRNFIRIINRSPNEDGIEVELIKGQKYTKSSNISKMQRKKYEESSLNRIQFFDYN